MYIKVGGEFGDVDLANLCELLDMLDEKITEIVSLVSKSRDPESDGLCDRGEYFVGVGFVAIQQYLNETRSLTGIKKNEAYGLGPVHSTGITYIGLFNYVANWWKHEAEWWEKQEDGGLLQDGKETAYRVYDAAGTTDYPLSGVLASLCAPESLSLAALVPYLEQWRAAVDSAADSKPERDEGRKCGESVSRKNIKRNMTK